MLKLSGEFTLLFYSIPLHYLSFEIIQKTLGGDVGQDTEYKFYIKEVVLERKRSPPDAVTLSILYSRERKNKGKRNMK